MNFIKVILLNLFLLFVGNVSYSQLPSESVWGVYASGVGEKLKPGMDPCWITYTVAFTDNPKIMKNVELGLMGVITSNVNWFEATATQRLHSQYFDDEPDGFFKLRPCEIVLPSVQGTWIWHMGGRYVISQSGSKITGSANGINDGDHWGKGHREGGSIAGYIEDDGTIVLKISWGDGTYSEDIMTLSSDGGTLSGAWNWYTNSSKSSKKGSGSYSLSKN